MNKDAIEGALEVLAAEVLNEIDPESDNRFEFTITKPLAEAILAIHFDYLNPDGKVENMVPDSSLMALDKLIERIHTEYPSLALKYPTEL
jgi:hypothetical protein